MIWAFAVAICIGLGVALAGRFFNSALLTGIAGFLLVFLALLLVPTEPEPLSPATAPPRDAPSSFGRTILEQVPSPLLVISAKGRMTYANSAARRLMPRIEVGTHFAGLVRAPAFVEAVSDVLQSGTARASEFRYGTPERYIEAYASALPAGSEFGDGRQVIVRFDDRTEARRTAEMRSAFIANASHELRTPIASLLGYIETLRTHGADDPEAQEKFLGIMDKQARRMQRLVDDLMSLSRIEMAAHEPPKDIAPFFALAEEAALAVEPMARAAQMDLRVELPQEDVPILCDQDQVVQVVTNLLDNALKYGDSPIILRAAPPDLTRPGLVGIEIRDHGQGIPAQDLHRLTERFFRVNIRRSREAGGTGLGLAIVKHILHRHGGDLEIRSKEGEGSQFIAWFTRQEDLQGE